MKEFYKLIIPEKVEIVLFLSVSACFLLIQNVKRFWLLLQGDAIIVAKKTDSIDSSISNFITNNLNDISPRLVDFLLWALIGCVVFIVISFIIALIKNLDEEAELLHYYRSPKGRIHEINSFLVKYVIRLTGLISFVIWLLYFVDIASPTISRWFFAAAVSLNELSSWLWLLFSIVLLAACLYVFAILARLVVLKPRVFGTVSE